MALANTNFGYQRIKELLLRVGSVYFIGIGGVSMSCLAEMCVERGYRVAGSDRTPSGFTHRLEEKGIRVFYEHRAEQVEGFGIVVYTLAIDKDNPEYNAAVKAGIPVVSRADFLGYLMHEYGMRIGVSGMHGKSTVTAMLSAVLDAGKVAPTVLSGASLNHHDGCYRKGKRDFFLYEACEYMGSFLRFYPTVAVILNMEMDHPDYFHSMDDVRLAFRGALDRLPADGCAILNADDAEVLDLKKGTACRTLTFGLKEKADFSAKDIQTKNGLCTFTLVVKGEDSLCITLKVPGLHNVTNALAVAAVAHEAGISPEALKEGLEAFEGARRRMEYHAVIDGVAIYEDYAHHPTEIRASLQAAKQMTEGDVWCVFQSHTYSRTAELFSEFTEALLLADHGIILPIYAAREINVHGVSGEKLASSLGGKGTYMPDFKSAADYVLKNAKNGDLIIVMGAGDVFHVLEEMGISTLN